SLRVILASNIAFERILLASSIVSQKFQLRRLGIGVVNRGINLRFGKITSCVQFGSIQFHDGLSGSQGVAFPGKNLFDSTAATRTYMHFVHLNCSGDGIAPMPASRGEERQRKQRCAANTIVDL